MKILKKISKVIVIVMAVLATIWCGLYVYANYFYNDKQIDVENFYIAELPLTPSQFEEDFKEIHQIVMENYSLYQAKHNQLTEHQKHLRRLTFRRTRARVYSNRCIHDSIHKHEEIKL